MYKVQQPSLENMRTTIPANLISIIATLISSNKIQKEKFIRKSLETAGIKLQKENNATHVPQLAQNAHLQTRSATPTFPKEQFEQEPSDTQSLAAFTFAVLFVGLFFTLSRRFTNFPLCLAATGSVQELKGARAAGARGGCRSSCFGCRGAASWISSLGLLTASECLSVPISPPWVLIKGTTMRILLEKKKNQNQKKLPKKKTQMEKKPKHQTANQKHLPNYGGKRKENISSWGS